MISGPGDVPYQNPLLTVPAAPTSPKVKSPQEKKVEGATTDPLRKLASFPKLKIGSSVASLVGEGAGTFEESQGSSSNEGMGPPQPTQEGALKRSPRFKGLPPT